MYPSRRKNKEKKIIYERLAKEIIPFYDVMYDTLKKKPFTIL